MSRHLIYEDGDEGVEVFVGWDPPLQRFFLQELVTLEDGEEYERTSTMPVSIEGLVVDALKAGYPIDPKTFHGLLDDARWNV